jgi:hypothetical protein
MIEHIPDTVDRALLYLHSGGASGDEISPYLAGMKRQLPTTYIWSGDGYITGSPQMGADLTYGRGQSRYWFTFPMQDASSAESFRANTEPMGAVLACCGAYLNAFVDTVTERFALCAQQVILCGQQHGSCAALAAAMVRKQDPYQCVVLFDPYPLETYYLSQEQHPATTVVCVDTPDLRARNLSWLGEEVDALFRSYGMNTETVTLAQESKQVEKAMFDELISRAQGLV